MFLNAAWTFVHLISCNKQRCVRQWKALHVCAREERGYGARCSKMQSQTLAGMVVMSSRFVIMLVCEKKQKAWGQGNDVLDLIWSYVPEYDKSIDDDEDERTWLEFQYFRVAYKKPWNLGVSRVHHWRWWALLLRVCLKFVCHTFPHPHFPSHIRNAISRLSEPLI